MPKSTFSVWFREVAIMSSEICFVYIFEMSNLKCHTITLCMYLLKWNKYIFNATLGSLSNVHVYLHAIMLKDISCLFFINKLNKHCNTDIYIQATSRFSPNDQQWMFSQVFEMEAILPGKFSSCATFLVMLPWALRQKSVGTWENHTDRSDHLRWMWKTFLTFCMKLTGLTSTYH